MICSPALSMTSSCSKLATWIISVISAILCCRRLSCTTRGSSCVLSYLSEQLRQIQHDVEKAVIDRIQDRSTVLQVSLCMHT